MRNQWRIKNLTGKTFNKLTVLGMEHSDPVVWKCKCECGNITYVRTNNLTSGNVKSCGCLHKIGNPKHNKCYTRLYRIRAKIIRRCFVEDDPAYPNYGGRGITMCEEWKNSVDAFINWAYANGYSDDLSIDRIDNNGNYCPENCRWSDRKEQSNNRRSNRYFTYNGKTKTLKQWCEEIGIPYKRTCSRIYNGWSFEEAISYRNDARIDKRGKEKESAR